MIKDKLHEAICKNMKEINAWYDQKRLEVAFSIYTSVDIRDSDFKVSSVDANIYPAGFNNICEADRETAVDVMNAFILAKYGNSIKNILLITEEHTNNPYYWQNVYALSEIIRGAGFEVRVSMPRAKVEATSLQTSNGNYVEIAKTEKIGGKLLVEDGVFQPDLVISNNDFSEPHAEWAEGLELVMNPPRELGWYQRKKSTHFQYFNQFAKEFAALIDVDPWFLQVDTKVFSGFNPNEEESKQLLANQVDEMLASINSKYESYGIDAQASVFIKNNAGTYGLAVTKVNSGSEVLSWNNKTRTKMKAAKGGRGVEEIILQEGIPSAIVSEESTAEPVIYMLGCQPVGGFLRTHNKKGPSESLNSPGAVYKRLCMTDLMVEPSNCPMENVYSWIAKLSGLAIGHEAKEMGVEFKNYQL